MPSMSITPAVATVFRSICPPSTVRLESAVVPPTAPCRSAAPVFASSVSVRALPLLSIVEVNSMLPAVEVLFASLSTLTLACRSTAPSKRMLASSLV